jgi:multidrug efflux pump subunit AcrA (membrane-fusion protein)
MRVSCALHVAVSPGSTVIPTWCLTNLRDPSVTMSDGTTRAVTGFAVEHDFVVTSGLSAGERISAAVPDGGKQSTRLTGIVKAAKVQPIKMSSDDWEVLEVIPDGSKVAAGDVIARLSKTSVWTDTQLYSFWVEFGAAQAQANLAISRINAERDLAKALVAWSSAARELDRARLDRLVERYATNDEQIAAALTALTQEEVKLGQAELRAQALDAQESLAGLSENERRSRRIALRQAEIARAQAQLTHIAAVRARNWLAVRESEEALELAQQQAASQRTSYSVARTNFQSSLASAQLRYRDELNKGRWARDQIADATVIAPRAGRVFQRLQSNSRLLRVGDELLSMEPFEIPIGTARNFTVEVPARLYGRYQVGAPIDFVIPALGLAPRRGTISIVGSYFAVSSADRADSASIAIPERVFMLTISFDLSEAEADKAPPGSTAYVDL